MKRNYKFGIGAVILVSAVGYLMYAGVEESSSYYFTIEEFLPQKAAMAGEGLRIAGRVSTGSLYKKTSTSGTEMKFRIGEFSDEHVEGAETLTVEYTGVVPDMFAEGRDVIVEGEYIDGVLQAKTVMTSCPSKYEPELEGAETDSPAATAY